MPLKKKSRSRSRRKGPVRRRSRKSPVRIRSRRKGPVRRSRKSPVRIRSRKSPVRRSRSRRKSPVRRSRRKRKSPVRRSRSRSRKNDGTGGSKNIVPGKKVGRFYIKSVINMSDYIKEELRNMDIDAKLNYSYDIDFTKEKEFNDILKSNNLTIGKIQLNKYIDLVKNYILYPKKETENFRENYLKKLLNLKQTLDKNITIFPQKKQKKEKRRKRKKPLDILEKIDEDEDEEEYLTLSQPSLSQQSDYENILPLSLYRQSSYEDTPYVENGIELYKHKTEPQKKRFYWSKDRYFDIIDQ